VVNTTLIGTCRPERRNENNEGLSEQNTFAMVSADLGLTLLEATFDRNGDLIAEDRPVSEDL
jgi:hypothetical protein